MFKEVNKILILVDKILWMMINMYYNEQNEKNIYKNITKELVKKLAWVKDEKFGWKINYGVL